MRGSSATAVSNQKDTPHPNPLPAEPGRGDKAKPLVAGKFGQALDGRAGGAFVTGREEFRQFPITVECWTKLADKSTYNILVANEQKSSGTHWEMFSIAGSGHFTAYLPGFAPDHCHSTAMICDSQWHHVAMVLELERVRLYVDGKQVADQPHKRSDKATGPGGLALASLVDRVIGCTGLVDEVRISKGVRAITAAPDKPFEADDTTVALWHLDELVEQKRFDDASPKKNTAMLGAAVVRPDPAKAVSKSGKIEGHWGEEAVGFRWTESDSHDDRFGNVDSGPFFSGSITGAGGPVSKGIVVRLGAKREASICYDTELLRASAGWNGFLKFDAARFGIIVPPKIDGDATFATPRFPGVSLTEQFTNFREAHPYGPLPKEMAHYKGLYRHGQRVVLKYTVGPKGAGQGARDEGQNHKSSPLPSLGPQPSPLGDSTILESPWLESAPGITAITRTILVSPTTVPLRMIIADAKAKVRLHARSESATLIDQPGSGRVLVIAPHDKPVAIKLLVASADTNEAAFDQFVAASPVPEDLLKLTQPGPTLWGEPLVTKGELAEGRMAEGQGLRGKGQKQEDSSPAPSLAPQPSPLAPPSPLTLPYVVDTITLPFTNPFHALFFCGGHDFLSDGRAAVCTLHGDVWLVDGIDETLKRITWRRFATGLFQPLGLKIRVEGQGLRGEGRKEGGSTPSLVPQPAPLSQLFVVGRDQITRLHDLNGDGEADFYENFNNDAHVTLNGHEYVTCLETDRAGNFYYVKGNCNSQTPHDGSLLRVSMDGSKLDVFATGFRNSNGIGIGPNDEITVAPQEGEWTPASAVFLVREGGFYGGMMSHHQATPPTDFIRPICWFPRLADNSSGGQVWTTSDRWGPLSNQLLHMSYGQCRLRLVLREGQGARAEGQGTDKDSRHGPTSNSSPPLTPQPSPLAPPNGGSLELPLRFNSGIHRARMNPHDGQLYVTGLKGWTTSAVHDGCFQRVRFTGQPIDVPIAMKTYGNGVALTFTRQLNRDAAEDPANYQLEAWNYKWSAAYGSPEYKPSAPGQIGRDELEAKSATLLEDNQTVFLELPNLKPVDQLSIGCTLLTHTGSAIKQSATLTLNVIPAEVMPDAKLHRRVEDPERARMLAALLPGVVLSGGFSLSGVDRLGQRMLAWSHEGLAPPNEFGYGSRRRFGGDNGRTVTASGWLRIPVTGRYRFSADPPESRTVLTIDRLTHASPLGNGVEYSLTRGFHPIEITQIISDTKPGHFRLMWESDQFPREAIPATVLKRHPSSADDRLSGAVLFARYHCANCHQGSVASPTPAENDAARSDNQAFFAALQTAPRLDAIGSRVEPAWLDQWIREPHQLRGDATMPSVIPKDDAATAGDIAAYLLSLREPTENQGAPNETPAAEAESTAKRGGVLFESLGCIACHTFAKPDARDEWNRVSLHFAQAKYRPHALTKFLLAPHAHHSNSRMPDFHLSEDEAASLAEHIRKESPGQLEATLPAGDAQRGRMAFEKLRCAQCHLTEKTGQLAQPDVPQFKRDEPRQLFAPPKTDPPKKPNADEVRTREFFRPAFGEPRPPETPAVQDAEQSKKWFADSNARRAGTGCLAPQNDVQTEAVRFHFDEPTRKSLIAFLAANRELIPLNIRSARSVSEWTTELRCNACHARDDQRSFWPEIVAEEGSGRAVESVPQLTWVGEKLQGPWIETLLKGELKQKPRPWLTARMPSFPAYASLLAHGMAAEHGVPFEEPLPKELDPDRIEIGRKLTLRDGGLDCRQCHGVGRELPRGDASTQIALGINFALARERLRPEFALRQMLDPPRYDPGSRMPRFAPDLRTTAAKHIENGDAKKQFEMLKEFLWSVRDE